MGFIAVITNCALFGIAAKSSQWLPDMTPVNAVLMFVAFEVNGLLYLSKVLTIHNSSFTRTRRIQPLKELF